MSLFDENLMEIRLYYMFREVNGSRILTILKDEKAETILADEEKKEIVEVLVTKWSMMNWAEQNNTVKNAYNRVDPTTGVKIFDHVAYRDVIIKSCLKEWDIKTDGGKIVAVTTETIDKLPGDIVMALFTKYESLLQHTEEELGN